MDSALRFLDKLQLFKVFVASFLSDVTSCIMGNREMFARSLSVSSVSIFHLRTGLFCPNYLKVNLDMLFFCQIETKT